jgi:hypothetical protein
MNLACVDIGRPSASWASTMRRCSGVYSSSRVGSLGWMLTTPPETLNSIFVRNAISLSVEGGESG